MNHSSSDYYGNGMTHSERLHNFTQYLWGDILENQCLSRELIDLLNDAGSKLEKAEKLLIESEPENNEKVMTDYVLIPDELSKKLLDMVNTKIKDCVDNPMYGGKAPKSLYKLRDDLMAAKGI